MMSGPFCLRRAALPLEEGALPWKLDYLLFSSAGGVEQFFAQYGAVPEGTVCACIRGGDGLGSLRSMRPKTAAGRHLTRETS